MNQEIKKKWVDALRSGDYDQTKGCLQDNNGFCCLGVLSDIHSKETKTNWEKRRGTNSIYYIEKYGTLPTEVIEWSGLKDYSPMTSKGSLVSLNDQGKEFPEIADIIESEL